MYKIKLKQWVECQRLHNVIATIRNWRNDAVDNRKAAKKNKDKELAESIAKDIDKYDKDLLDLSARLQKATQDEEKAAMECAILRTKVYVISYSLQGAVFDLKSFLSTNAVEDEGEAEYIQKLKECSDLLMKMPMEFGTYGRDNDAYNVCEEMLSEEIDRGVRVAFDEILSQNREKLQKKYST